MVRTHPRVAPLQVLPQHVEMSRVLGWSTAIAVHALAFLLLLIPATYVAAPLPRERTVVRILEVPAPKPPVPPVEIVPEQPRPIAPATPTPRVAPLPPPTASADDVLAVPPLPASDVTAPTLAPVEPAPPAPAAVQLQYRSAPPPAYPVSAIRANEQGTVLLRVTVGPDGKAANVVVERSSGSRALDLAARQQILRHWRFVPAQMNGQTVTAEGLVPVTFSLPD